MGYLNKAMIIGNLGADPDLRYLPSGGAVANISLATTEKWKDKDTGEEKSKTEWHKASIFGRRAEVLAEYARKGDALYIEGNLQTRKWTDSEGNDRWTTEINIRDFQFLGGGRRGGTDEDEDQSRRSEPRGQRQRQEQQPAPKDDFDDDIPF